MKRDSVARGGADFGTILLGEGAPVSGSASSYKVLFRCRKDGFDYLGQARIDAGELSFQVEMFNGNYYARLTCSAEEARAALKKRVLDAVFRGGALPEPFVSAVRSRIGLEGAPAQAAAAGTVELRDLFDRLNGRYFSGKIEARIQWGKNVRSRNRRSIRFGSYDAKRKLIRINPRLKQDFVPPPVLELTVYHEMCHQLLPPVRRDGKRRTHHEEFRRKEREYEFYREVKQWEKQNWRRLMAPLLEPMP